MENSGRFVPPAGMVDDISYEWFENPGFVSQVKGEASTYRTGGTPDTSLDSSIMDPAVVRAKAAGYRIVCAEDVYIHHFGQAAFKKLIENGEYEALWRRNQAYFESKWGSWQPHVHRTPA